MFRSTGSYEPDRETAERFWREDCRFDPQALTSLTSRRAGSYCADSGFDPQALTSLTDRQLLGKEK